MPSTSIVIPAFNREAYVGASIESVLPQISPGDEVIVVDDGSTDRTLEVVRQYPTVRVVSQPNLRIAGARNTGIDLARGDFIAFLDSDDLWLEGKLDRQRRLLEEQPDIDMVFCHIQSFLSPELNESAVGGFNQDIQVGIGSSCLLARRHVFDRVGRFDTTLPAGEFMAWLGRAHEAGVRHAVIPDLLVMRRVHLNNSVHNRAELHQGYLQVLRSQIARRRAMPLS